MGTESALISGPADLMHHFSSGAKSLEGGLRLGLEHEKIGVLRDGSAPDHARIVRLFERLTGHGWRRVEEQGVLVALEHSTFGNITLEPGGQIEHSGAPWPSAMAAIDDNDAHIEAITTAAAEEGITFLGVGFRPFGTLDQVPWMPKGRYRVMREYLPTRGRHGLEMMKRTATVQANLDYVDEADAMAKLRVALGVSSLVTAIFAASSLVDGRPSGYQSYRAACWLDTDPDRCGLLPFMFEPGAGFRDYIEWALDVPMFFVYRGGSYHSAPGLTFRHFLAEGWREERASLADWELHLSTLFPEVRLKRYVEVRQADAGPREMVRALPVLWRGLLYDAVAREAAWKLVAPWSMQERIELQRRVPREGLRATLRGTPVGTLCRELVEIARVGADRLCGVGACQVLAPLERIIAEGRTVADRMVEAWQEVDGDPARLIPRLRL